MKFENNGHRLSIIGAEIVTTIDVNVADSFVKYNKLETSGSGEARLYVGTRDKAHPFFGMEFINNRSYYKGIIHIADLLYYLETAKVEYEEPQNFYKRQDDMGTRFQLYYEMLNNFDDVNYFWVKLHNGPDDLRQNRIYIDGVIDAEVIGFSKTNRAIIYDYMRTILLPIMSKIQIIKLRDIETPGNEELLWFRPYIHETTRLYSPAIVREEERRIQNDTNLTSNQRFNLIAARVGQGKFRSDILDRYQDVCAISESNQIEILEACHIKPWILSTDYEKLDKRNGILLTRNLHKLFDLGFITFDENFDIVFSSYVTISASREFHPITVFVKNLLVDSIDYLDYHRNNIFVG